MVASPSGSPPEIPRREAFAALKAGLQTTAVVLERRLATGVAALDRLTGGGFPAGALVALEGDGGGWSIAAQLAARVTRRALAAVIDDGSLYPPSLAHGGARLERVLVVPARTPLGIARAADILLRSRACRLVLMPAPALRAAVWTRLAALAHRTGVLLVAVADGLAAASLSAAAVMRVRCSRERAIVAGLNGLWSTIAGYVVRAELWKAKSCATGASAVVRIVDRLQHATQHECVLPQRARSAHAAVR